MSRVDQLMDAARERAGGLEDFGDEPFRDGLEVLVASVEADAHLNDFGLQSTWHKYTSLLINRLEIEDWYRRHPEIDAQPIEAPLFILGLPRTGTTALSGLLSADPDIRYLRTWEGEHPCPPPETATEHSDPRIARAEAGLAFLHEKAPAVLAMHESTATGPNECHDLLGLTFRARQFEGTANVRSYLAWLDACDMEPGFRYHRRALKLLQWRCPPTRWRLKNPVALWCMDALDKVYPDARFVMTHRDPSSVIPSVCSLIHTLRVVFSDRVDREELGRQNVDTWVEALRRVIAFRERVGDERFCDVGFQEVVADPVAAAARIYEHFGEEFTPRAEQAMRGWFAANPKGKHGTHEYRAEDFGIDLAEVHERFAFYTDRFDVPLE